MRVRIFIYDVILKFHNYKIKKIWLGACQIYDSESQMIFFTVEKCVKFKLGISSPLALNSFHRTQKIFITGVREFWYHTELKWRTEIYCLKEHAEPLSKIWRFFREIGSRNRVAKYSDECGENIKISHRDCF